jgi:hypothetical protein
MFNKFNSISDFELQMSNYRTSLYGGRKRCCQPREDTKFHDTKIRIENYFRISRNFYFISRNFAEISQP